MTDRIRARLRRHVIQPALDGAAMPLELIREFLRLEAAGGLVLIASAVLAILCASTPLAPYYAMIKATVVTVTVGGFGVSETLLHWVNDGLMALFFFLVGLEIKREVLRGELSSMGQSLLPVLAAIGGMAVPALTYIAVTSGHPELRDGWAIPAATDIAFALGVMALAGSRVPQSLKVLLMAIAVVDDLGAIVIIAIFYTGDLSTVPLIVSAIGTLGLVVLNLSGVKRIAPYVLVGLICWVADLKSGVHATLAGVVTALAIPIDGKEGEGSPLEHLEHILHPWIAFGVLPLFGFLNAGVSLAHLDPAAIAAPITLGVAAGLFLGKQLGVFTAIMIVVMSGLAPKPAGASWPQIYGVCVLAGIGFTMSLFIGELAFKGGLHEAELRLGILGASIVSALIGYLLLRACARAASAAS